MGGGAGGGDDWRKEQRGEELIVKYVMDEATASE